MGPSRSQGDACDLPSNLSQFDAVLAANLVCRLPEPMKFFDRLPSLVKPGGVLVLVSPHSWLEAWTPKDKWIGGHNKVSKGQSKRTAGSQCTVLDCHATVPTGA